MPFISEDRYDLSGALGAGALKRLSPPHDGALPVLSDAPGETEGLPLPRIIPPSRTVPDLILWTLLE